MSIPPTKKDMGKGRDGDKLRDQNNKRIVLVIPLSLTVIITLFNLTSLTFKLFMNVSYNILSWYVSNGISFSYVIFFLVQSLFPSGAH